MPLVTTSKTFYTTEDATPLANWNSGTGAETSNGYWNGVYRALPVGVVLGNVYSMRSLFKIPINFATLVGPNNEPLSNITGANLLLTYYNVSTGNVVQNTGTRTVDFHQELVYWAETTIGSDDPATGWKGGSPYTFASVAQGAGDYDATPFASKTYTGTIANNAVTTLDCIDFIANIAPSTVKVNGSNGGGDTNRGILMRQSDVTQANNGAQYYSRQGSSTKCPRITITYQYTTNQAPTAPTPLSPRNGVLQTGNNVDFSATFNDPDTGDTPSKFDIQVSTSPTFTTTSQAQIAASTTLYNKTVTDTTSPLNTSVPRVGNFVSDNTNYYWRIRSYDALGAGPSPWSSDANAYFTVPTDTTGTPPPVGGNPDYTTTKSNARNKYRLEFYPMLSGLTGFDSLPSAVIFDAKAIGVGHMVNSAGEFFFTLPSDHKQIAKLVPQRTFWRASRWDEYSNLYRVMGEGLLTNTMQTANEVVFYGTDKLGMANRSIVSTSDVSATYSHVGVTLEQLHDSIFRRVSRSYAVTAASVASGIVTYTSANHKFVIGDVVSVTNMGVHTVSLGTVTDVTPNTSFSMKTAATGSVTSAGTATLATTVMDMGWGSSPATYFRDYSVTNPTYPTATETKSVQVSGRPLVEALSGFADILMAGTTNKVIIENANIGQPAAKIDTMNVALRHRHVQATDIIKPLWWFQYGVNVKRYKIEDNLDKMATRASVINRNLDSSTSSSYYSGTTDAALYAQYGLIDNIEIINEERNDINFAAQLQYNLAPDRLFTVVTDVVPNSIIPFKGYAVGDDITVHIVHGTTSVKKTLTVVAQQWIGNSNGAEFIAFSFAPRIEQSFIIEASTPEDAPGASSSGSSYRGKGSTKDKTNSAESLNDILGRDTYSWEMRDHGTDNHRIVVDPNERGRNRIKT
ncbi:hypothetical protein UFOVP1344_8 [uncultured Caudovirales phage]|uniref:Uncharacterized protein n=1 Tax=uncultured Caudovirales phage TaxID=2100421 RepID=A0A6J5PZN9_9CAUD|nr:hypothetical protein UFOVP1005_8 [uncultured Caudovirales phage]CAB4199710.1 hypothetical protein UFOVP1344_8 [uncultured Caudovirales phage]CAB4218478.1 hypothetical protein UFOVP1602_32 [uncultured Caudovirales phage]